MPAENSNFSDCKSAIKAIEFLSQRMPTSDFHVVPNTFEAWKQAVEAVISQIPEQELQKGKEVNAMLKATRDSQFQQWLAVVDFLRDRRPDPVMMRRLSRKIWPYRFAYSRFQPILMPIRTLLQKYS